MDFFSKLLRTKTAPAQSGNGQSPAADSADSAKDHESYVNFAREFIEEIVENAPQDRANSTFSSAQFETTDKPNLSSAFSELSLVSNLSNSTFESSLPDLLQPEAVYKKQVDTDTDTTDYESAVESDHLEDASLAGVSFIDSTSSSSFCFQNSLSGVVDQTLSTSALEATFSVASVSGVITPNASVQETPDSPQGDYDLTPSEDFEDAETSLDESYAHPSLNLTELCVGVGNLCLETPKADNLGRPSYADEALSPEFLITLNYDSNNTSCNGDSVGDVSYVKSNLPEQEQVEEESFNVTFCDSLQDSFVQTSEVSETSGKSIEPELIQGVQALRSVPVVQCVAVDTEESLVVPDFELSASDKNLLVEPATSVSSLPEENILDLEAAECSSDVLVAVAQTVTQLEELTSSNQSTQLVCETEFVASLPFEAPSQAEIVTTVETLLKEAEENGIPVHTFEKQAEDIVLVSEEKVGLKAEEILPVFQAPEKQPEETLPVVQEFDEIIPIVPPQEILAVIQVLEKQHKEIVPVGQVFKEIVPVEQELEETVPVVETLEKQPEEIVQVEQLKEIAPVVETLEKQPEEIVTVKQELRETVPVVETLEKQPEEIVTVQQELKEIVPVFEALEKQPEEIVTVKQQLEEIVPVVQTLEKQPEEIVTVVQELEEIVPVVETLEKQPEEILPVVQTLEKQPEEIVTVVQELEEIVPVIQTLKVVVPVVQTLGKQTEEIVPVVRELEKIVPVEQAEVEIIPVVKAPEKQQKEIVPVEAPVKLAEEYIVPKVQLIEKQAIEAVPVASFEKQSEEAIVSAVETLQKQSEEVEPIALDITVSSVEVTSETGGEKSFTTFVTNSKEPPALLPAEEHIAPSKESLIEQLSHCTLNAAYDSTVSVTPTLVTKPTVQLSTPPHRFSHGDGLQNDSSTPKTVSPFTESLLKRSPLEGDLSSQSSRDSLQSLFETCKRQQRQLEKEPASPRKLDFSDVASEAAKVSEDIHNASREFEEPVAMTTRGADDSVPLDVKWLSDRQGGGVTPSPKSKLTAVHPEDDNPFTPKSRLKSTPPREMDSSAGGDASTVTPNRSYDKQITSDAANVADVNQSEAGPEIAQHTNVEANEVFADSAGFDFLSSMGSSEPSRRLGLESLYVKFDPLVSAAPVANTTDRNIPLPPKFHEAFTAAAAPSAPRHVSPDRGTEQLDSDHKASPRLNPAIAFVDRLISLSPSPLKAGSRQVATPPPPPVVKQEKVTPARTAAAVPNQDEMNEELLILRELLDRQDTLHEETLSRLAEDQKALEYQLNGLQVTLKRTEEREQALLHKVTEQSLDQQQMSRIMEEYEKTISSLVSEKEHGKKEMELELAAVTKEKDVALGHLTNIEIAFSDVHKKYERSKIVIEGFKKNEEVLRESLTNYEAKIHQQEQKYDMLKSHAMQQLESANHELDAVRRSQQAESAKYRAMMKKSELKVSSLEELLEQKQKENRELTSICDDLIAKVGS